MDKNFEAKQIICTGSYGKALCFKCKLWHPYDQGTILPGTKHPEYDDEFICERFVPTDNRKVIALIDSFNIDKNNMSKRHISIIDSPTT